MASRHVAHKTSPLRAESSSRIQRFQRCELKLTQPPERSSSKLAARELMTAPVVTVRPEESVERAARIMSELDCGALPVVDRSSRLIGIIASSDITTRLIARGISVTHAQVSDCMTHQAFACSVELSTEDCIRAMSWHQVKRMPIVDKDHRVIGIISMSDLARYVCEHRDWGQRLGFADALWQLAGQIQVSQDLAG
jgi:CBS domain-containing protein